MSVRAKAATAQQLEAIHSLIADGLRPLNPRWGVERGWLTSVPPVDSLSEKDAARLLVSLRRAVVKPASPSQISYAKALVAQATRGIGTAIKPWSALEELPSDDELEGMDQVTISHVIDTIKAGKKFSVERFGNGSFRVVSRNPPRRLRRR